VSNICLTNGSPHFYENIRQQVEADRANKHQFMANPTVRQYADKLRKRNDQATVTALADRVAVELPRDSRD